MIQQQTTTEIHDLIIAELDAKLGRSSVFIPRSFRRVLARVLAGMFVLIYKYAGFIALQSFAAYASDKPVTINGRQLTPLVELGRRVGVGDPVGATNAELRIAVSVVDQTGSILSGTQLTNPLTGVTYVTLYGVDRDAPTVYVTVRAVDDPETRTGAGSVGNLAPGGELRFANAPPGVAPTATVDSVEVQGADAESTAAYRQRVIDRTAKPPQGGAYADYELWGEEAAGIVNVYPYTGDPGQVNVYAEATPASSGNPDGVPTTAQLTAVLNAIQLDSEGRATRRNANAFVNVYPITRTGFTAVVSGIADVPDLAAVRADILTAMGEYFAGVEPYIAGLSIPPRNDQLTRTRLSAIVEEIVTAAGGTFTSVIFYPTGTPGSLTAYVLGEGEKAKLDEGVFL